MKKVLILGSTGSIGTQALEVIAASEDLQAVGLAAGSGWELALEQAREHGVPAIALADEKAAARAREDWSGRVLSGEEGVRELIADSGADLVLNGIVGAAGLASTVVALSEGIDVALANKESLVVGGFLIGTMAFWFAGLYQNWLTGVDALIIGAAVAAVAPVGDLFESMLKRDLGKKDTGTLFGPHGGILDRLDAVFFTVVVGYYLAVALVY